MGKQEYEKLLEDFDTDPSQTDSRALRIDLVTAFLDSLPLRERAEWFIEALADKHPSEADEFYSLFKAVLNGKAEEIDLVDAMLNDLWHYTASKISDDWHSAMEYTAIDSNREREDYLYERWKERRMMAELEAAEDK